MAANKIPDLILPSAPDSIDPEAIKTWTEDLRRTLQTHFELVTSSINEVVDGKYDRLRYHPQASEPAEPEEGHVTFADGTDWDPGAGAGLYEYNTGAWVKL